MAKTTRTTEEPPPENFPALSPGDERFGETRQITDGEADSAAIIKANNMRRVYLQNGLPWPPSLEPSEPVELPHIESLSPDSIEAGTPDVVLGVFGSDFTEAAKVRFDGVEQDTTFVSATNLTVPVSPDEAVDIAVQVHDETGDSNTVTLVVTEPPPITRRKP